MKLIDLPFFVELGASIESARNVDAKGDLFDAYIGFYRLRDALGKLDRGDQVRLSATEHDLAELKNALFQFEQKYFFDDKNSWRSPNREDRAEYEIAAIINKINQFNTVLIADLRVSSTFSVMKTGIFEVNQLVNCASNALSENSKKKLGQEILSEIDASGRCLGFNLPTASGFHAMRAVERVIKLYLSIFTSEDEISKMRNWGQYISALEKALTQEGTSRPSSEAVALIRQIKDIYRNPVIHPDRVLSSDEASTLFHSTLAAINRVSTEIPAKEPLLHNVLSGLLGAGSQALAL